ncbi:L-selectin [Anableps anableps]
MNWTEARAWCQAYFTDMVVIQNQTENDYIVSILPNKTSSPYYWIGITKEHMNETWRWVGNNSTWVGKHSWAQNEPNNNHVTEFCVEIYVNSGQNRGKWNDEKCDHKKFAVCYKAVKCSPLSQPLNGSHSCSKEAQIFNSTCHFKCYLGFFMIGSSAVTCAADGHWTGPRPVCARKKRAQDREPEDATSPSSDVNGGTSGNSLPP